MSTLRVPILRRGEMLGGQVIDLDQVVRDFASGGAKPPLVLADPIIEHQQTGQPAVGWVVGLRRHDDGVVATITQVAPLVAAAFREGGGECHGLLLPRDGGWFLHSVRVSGVALPRVHTLDALAAVLADDAPVPRATAAVAFAAAPPRPSTRRNRCPTCGETQSCVPEKSGGFTCTLCVAHVGDSDHRYAEEGTTMPERIDLAEEIRWAERRRGLWSRGQRTDYASAEAFVGGLLERARLRAFQAHLRETATANGLDLRDYTQRAEAAALCLQDEPDWRVDTWRDLNPALQARVTREYTAVKRAEDLKLAQRERAVPAVRPDPQFAARDAAVRAAARRDGLDLGTQDGVRAAVERVARAQPALVPRFGRNAEVTAEDANAARLHREATLRVLTEQRRRAEEPPAAPLPPAGGYWY